MSKTDKVIGLYDKYIMTTYKRVPFCLEKAKGAKVWDIDGKSYLDFFPGWAVSGIGHCHPMVSNAVAKQAKKLIHVSNNYYSKLQGLLAKKIIEESFKGKVFFANSGAEANEAAVKLARRYGHDKGRPACQMSNGQQSGRYQVITMLKSFHGRTLGMIAATGQEKVKKGFEPIPEGFVHIPFNDIEARKEAITDKTAAVMFEPIQCEGGINIATLEYMKEVRKICDEKDILMILDEVQTGMGRTGEIFCFKNYGVTPDVMTLAKAIGGGVPIGACVAREKFQDVLTPGTHASTFGGSPLVSAAALAVFEAIKKEKLLANTKKQGAYLTKKLEALKKKYHFIKEIRSMGLVIGVELSVEGDSIYSKCLEEGLLINCTQGNILRIMPPMNVTKAEIDKAISILDKVFAKV